LSLGMNDVMPSHVIPKKIQINYFSLEIHFWNVSGKWIVILFIVPTK